MIFRRIASEYRMVSDDDKIEFFLLFTDPEGVWHFRLVSSDWQLDFEAVQILNSILEWQVERVFETTLPKTTNISNELVRSSNSADFFFIVQALSDFGHFFGEKAGEVKVSLKTNTIYRNPLPNYHQEN